MICLKKAQLREVSLYPGEHPKIDSWSIRKVIPTISFLDLPRLLGAFPGTPCQEHFLEHRPWLSEPLEERLAMKTPETACTYVKCKWPTKTSKFYPHAASNANNWWSGLLRAKTVHHHTQAIPQIQPGISGFTCYDSVCAMSAFVLTSRSPPEVFQIQVARVVFENVFPEHSYETDRE